MITTILIVVIVLYCLGLGPMIIGTAAGLFPKWLLCLWLLQLATYLYLASTVS